MAQNIWLGLVSSDCTDEDNWSLSLVPATGDDVLVPASATNSITGTIANAINSFNRVDNSQVVISYLVITLQSQTNKNVRIGGTVACSLSVSYASTIEISQATSVVNSYGVMISGTNNTELQVDSQSSGNVGIGFTNGTYGVTAATTEITTLVLNGGITTISPVTTFTSLTQNGGVVNSYAGQINTIQSGQFNVFNVGGTYTVNQGGVVDLTQDIISKTITNLNVYKSGSWNDSNSVGTYTNPITLVGCGLEDCSIKIGKGRHIMPS